MNRNESINPQLRQLEEEYDNKRKSVLLLLTMVGASFAVGLVLSGVMYGAHVLFN